MTATKPLCQDWRFQRRELNQEISITKWRFHSQQHDVCLRFHSSCWIQNTILSSQLSAFIMQSPCNKHVFHLTEHYVSHVSS
jgi:hypothetical protein